MKTLVKKRCHLYANEQIKNYYTLPIDSKSIISMTQSWKCCKCKTENYNNKWKCSWCGHERCKNCKDLLG
jgi:hypothetical protein